MFNFSYLKQFYQIKVGENEKPGKFGADFLRLIKVWLSPNFNNKIISYLLLIAMWAFFQSGIASGGGSVKVSIGVIFAEYKIGGKDQLIMISVGSLSVFFAAFSFYKLNIY